METLIKAIQNTKIYNSSSPLAIVTMRLDEAEDLLAWIRNSIAEERNACAITAEETASGVDADAIAEAIRAR